MLYLGSVTHGGMEGKNVLFPAEALEIVISTNNCQILERKRGNNIFREALKDIGQFWGSEKGK